MTSDEFFINDVKATLGHAVAMHKPFNSHHEAYAVILEELDEYWEEVRKKRSRRDNIKMRGELRQIAAMAIRAPVELT